MPPPPEGSTATASLDSLSDKELTALAKRFIENYDQARAKRRKQLPLKPVAIDLYFQEPRSRIEVDDPWVARALAEEIFRRYMQRPEAPQLPSSPPEIPEISSVPEA
ncbi:hypothetical protein HY411_00120 [Candidatus Gottesmanbacteria bacterium]|nr:hypothetical protein [Candidatus Gottesmanbacteria bacterium]